MKALIYYFTGTGNSLLVARKIAERLDGAVLKPIMELAGVGEKEACADSALMQADAVGFVFPVYFDRTPEIIRKAMEKGQFNKTQYIFAVTTSGAKTENALYEINSILRSRNMRLSYGKNVTMPDNSIILSTSQNEADKRLKQVEATADEIAVAVRNVTPVDKEFQQGTFLSILGHINKSVFMHYYKAEKRSVDRARCSQCGICVKLCPVGNISMAEGEVRIGDHCQWCFGCLNWCPQKAIKFGQIDPAKKHQYQCPGMKLSDIISKSKV